MATYTVQDSQSGKTITFEWNGAQAPTEQDMAEVFAQAQGMAASAPTDATATPADPGQFSVSSAVGQPERSWANVPQEAFGNIPGSAVQMGKNIASAVAHPIDTVSALGKVVGGALGEVGAAYQPVPPGINNPAGPQGAGATGEWSPYAQEFEAVVGMMKDRYGSLDALKQTIATDPVGFAADLSAVLTGGGAMATGVAPRVGQVAGAVGKAIDPVRAAVNMAKAPITGIGKTPGLGRAMGEISGAMTGTGYGVVKRALRGGKEFRAAMAGDVSGTEILDNAKQALGALKDARAEAYLAKLETVRNSTKTISLAPIKRQLEAQLKRFNIARNGDDLDFARSTIDTKAQNKIKEVVNLIDDWGSRPGDNTPIMLDTLKRRLDDFYAETNNSRVMVTALKDTVRGTISRELPQYAEMTKDYAKVSTVVKDIERSLSLGTRASADTAINKLSRVLRDNNEFRRDLVQALDKYTDRSITGQIAGYELNPVVPKGAFGRIMAGAGSFGAVASGEGLLPLMGLFAVASPRLTGNFLNAMGWTARQGGKIPPGLRRFFPQAAFQAGRAHDQIGE